METIKKITKRNEVGNPDTTAIDLDHYIYRQ